jgi:S-adenosylmethionine-diacylglycerol 3-amino-3-carboxypropyl transferase
MGRMGRDKAFFDHVDGSPAQHVARRIRHAGIDVRPRREPVSALDHEGHPRRCPAHDMARGPLRDDPRTARPAGHPARVARSVRVDRGTADGFNLSDIFEYMSPDMFETVYESILDAANPGARLVYWNMMAPRRVPPHAAAPGADAHEARGSAEGAGQGVLLFRFRHRGGHRVSPAARSRSRWDRSACCWA